MPLKGWGDMMKTRIFFFTVVLTMLSFTAWAGWFNLFPKPLAPQDMALFEAVLRNNLSEATRLTQAGASPNAIVPNGNSIMQNAVVNGHIEIVKMMLRNKGDVNLVSRDGLTALYLAKKPEMHKLLLENGADPFVRTEKNRYSPFEFWCNVTAHITTEAEKKKVMDTIKSQGLSAKREQFEHTTWLTRADLVETVKIHQSYKYDINQTSNINKQTPLHIAAMDDKFTLMQILIAAGARPDLKDKDGNDPLAIITRYSQSKNGNNDFAAVVKALVNAGADINSKDVNNNTPLCNAAVVGNPSRVGTLLAVNGITVNERCEYGENALFKTNVMAVSRALVAAGADVNHESDWSYTPLFAVTDPEVVTFLLKSGANVHHLNKTKESILVNNLKNANEAYKVSMDENRITNAYLRKFEIIIKAGINVNEGPSQNTTPLVLAKRVPFTKFVALLEKSGAR